MDSLIGLTFTIFAAYGCLALLFLMVQLKGHNALLAVFAGWPFFIAWVEMQNPSMFPEWVVGASVAIMLFFIGVCAIISQVEDL